MARLLTASTFLALILFTCAPSTRAATYVYDDTVAYVWQSSAPISVTWEGSCTSYPNDDDKQLVNIGFTFNFAGIDYTQVRILGNGALHFGADQGFHKDYTNEAMPITAAGTGPCGENPANRVIAGYWDDLEPSQGGTVTYETIGLAPNRLFVSTWTNIAHYPNTGSYTFQIILYEGSNYIKFQYGPGDTDGSSATIGVEVDDTDFTPYSFNTNSVSNGDAILFYRPPHFAISHDTLGDVCQTENITISLHDPVHAIQTPYTGTITLSTSTGNGDWSLVSGNGTLTNLGSGNGTYVFAAGDNSQIILGLTYLVSEIVNINITDGTISEGITEDNDLTFSGASDTFRDNFNSNSFANNDGTVLWTGDWIEADGAGAGPTAGNARIIGGNLNLDDRPNTGGDPSLEREADLSSYSNATLSFDYQTTNGVDNSDAVVVEISDDGGANWTILETFTGISGSSSGSRSYNITVDSNMSANTRIRFRVSNLYGGNNEQFQVDFVEISALLPCQGVDHYVISHDGTGITCNTDNITITACQDAPCLTQYTGTVDLTLTASGNTTGTTDSIPLSFSGGSTTYALRHTTPEVVTLGINGPTPIPATANTCLNTATATASCDITFYEAGFIFDVPPQTSCQTSGNVTISAVRTDITTQQCVPGFISRTEDIYFWSTYVTPATGTKPVQINSTNIATATPGTAISLTFDASGQSTFDVTYDDAGDMQLNSRFDGIGTETGLVMLGADTFVVKPDHFEIRAYDNATATDLDGSVTWVAADNFDFAITATCADGTTITQNYAPEADDHIEFRVERTDPAGVNSQDRTFTIDGLDITDSTVPAFQNAQIAAASFTNGAFTDNAASYNDIGMLNLTVQDNNYYGETFSSPAGGLTVGRFIPDVFAVSIAPDPPTFTNSCILGATMFTYLGDSFGFTTNPTLTVTPLNSAGITTVNYEGAHWQIPNQFTVAYSDPAAPVALSPASGTTSAANITDCNGSITVTISDTFAYTRPAESSPKAEFQTNATDFTLRVSQAQLTDALYFSVCHDTGAGCQDFSRNPISGALLRHGRLSVADNFGPETEDITNSPFEAQYYDGTSSSWITNSDDNCTTVTELCPLLRVNSISSPLSSGQGTMTVTTAGSPETIDVCLSKTPPSPLPPVPHPEWLTDLADCTIPPNDTCGKLTFGIYRGNDRIINWREIVR